MMSRHLTLATFAAGLVLTPAVHAYLTFGSQIGNQVVPLKWNATIQYSVTNRDISGVTAAQLQQLIAKGLGTWADPENVSIPSQFLGFTALDPTDGDLASTIGFRSRPDLDRTLGQTSYDINEATGQLLASDIFLNSIFQWSIAPNGETGKFDVESVLNHELGHFLGLGHSMLGETSLISGGRRVDGKRSIMFPIAFGPGSIVDRNLQADDISGITDVYGDANALNETGAIQGRVTLNGAGVYGAHVTVFNPATGDLVSGYTLTPAGHFVISGLKPGQYIVRAEPLDDVDQDSVFDPDDVININFQVTFFEKPVSVPAGGAGAPIVIAVKSK
jgi:hypothetical protein